MNKSNINEQSAGTEADSSTTAQNHSVSQPNANTNVVGIPKRILKFRAWSTIIKHRMVYLNTGAIQDIMQSDNWHVMQFTGFKDVNGKEIYEGDILSVWYSRDTTGKDIVKFNHIVEWEETNGFSGWNTPFLETAEIIGNIFENPELLHSVA